MGNLSIKNPNQPQEIQKYQANNRGSAKDLSPMPYDSIDGTVDIKIGGAANLSFVSGNASRSRSKLMFN